MNKEFYGRCHPDNIWSLKGLHKAWSLYINKLQLINTEDNNIHINNLINKCNELSMKISKLISNPNYDVDIKVACMCAVRS